MEKTGTSATKAIFGVGVAFEREGSYSKSYTYLSPVAIGAGVVVVVETDRFYRVGITTGCVENPTLNPTLLYRRVVSTTKLPDKRGQNV